MSDRADDNGRDGDGGDNRDRDRDEEHVEYRDDEEATQLALFRYGVIGPLVERETFGYGEVTALVKEIAAQTHYLPGTGPVTVSERTVYVWLAQYRKAGIEALRPRLRNDRGTRRALSDAMLQRAIELRKEQPARWTKTVLDILRLEGWLERERVPHRSTMDRHLAERGASRRQLRTLGEKRTIKMRYENFGDLWVGDY